MRTDVPTLSPSVDPSFTGLLLRDGRRAGFCWDERPRCVNVFGGEPHRLSTRRPVLTDTIARCEHRPAKAQGECGARVYVARLHFAGNQGVWFVVEVTPEHVQRLGRDPMILLEKLALVDCVLPGVEADLLGRA